jgi:group I intron endonuclease
VKQPFGYVYLIINRLNGRCYVGQTTQLRERLKAHVEEVLGGTTPHPLYDDMRQLGLRWFSFSILDAVFSKSELSLAEVRWGRILRASIDHGGYSRRVGGRTGFHSVETKLKISLAQKGIPKPIGFGERIRQELVGIPHSKERAQKTAVARVGVKKPNTSLALKGRKTGPTTQSTKEKLSKALTGAPRHCGRCGEPGHNVRGCSR